MRIPSQAAAGLSLMTVAPLVTAGLHSLLFLVLATQLARLSPAQPPRVTIDVLPDGVWLAAAGSLTPGDLVELLRESRSAHGEALRVVIRADRSIPFRDAKLVLMA